MSLKRIVKQLFTDDVTAAKFIELFWAEDYFTFDKEKHPELTDLIDWLEANNLTQFNDGMLIAVIANYALEVATRKSLEHNTMFDLAANVSVLLNVSLPFIDDEFKYETLLNHIKYTTYLRKRPLAKLLDISERKALSMLMLLSTMNIVSPNTQGYRKTTICNEYLSAVSKPDFTNFLRFYK